MSNQIKKDQLQEDYREMKKNIEEEIRLEKERLELLEKLEYFKSEFEKMQLDNKK